MLSCGGPPKIHTVNFNEYTMDNEKSRIQTISNVTIEVSPLSPSKSYDYPELFSFQINNMPEYFKQNVFFSTMFPKDLQGNSWLYTFGTENDFLTAFKIKITNKTSHILRMKDTRIYLVVDGEEPIAATTFLGNSKLVKVSESTYWPISYVESDKSLIYWITYFEAKYNAERPKGFLSIEYPIGVASQVINLNKRAYKLINDVNKEILPDFSYEGILVFPAIVSFNKVKLMFYDITTKTDAAGNPIEKAKFEFNLRLDNVDMWYDNTEKKWKIGSPPIQAQSVKK